MRKELLRRTQPVVYRALENACTKDRVHNAYLFSGPAGTHKFDAALLLAMSLLCPESDGLACEQCNTCRRVLEGEHADVAVLDGSKGSISKEQIDALQQRFSRTAAEEGRGRAVYIIRNAENASLSAMNSMLKFLEEPGDHVTAILTTDNINRLLPTIVSRCIRLPFVPVSAETARIAAVEMGIPEADAALLARVVRREEELLEIYGSGEYKTAQEMMKQAIGINGDPVMLLTDYEYSFRAQSTDRAKAKESDLRTLTLFFGLLDAYAHDAVTRRAEGPKWYREAVRKAPYTKEQCAELIRIVSEQKDRVNKYNDLNLVMCQTCWRLEEFNHE